MRGEVVDTGVTATTLEELGPGRHGASYTGQKIVLPNSMLLTSPVVNEHEEGPFVLHSFSVPFKLGEDIAVLERILLDAAHKALDPKDPALVKFAKKMSHLLDFPLAGLAPKFQVRFTESETAWLQISLFLPVQQLPDKEHEICKAYLDWRHRQQQTEVPS